MPIVLRLLPAANTSSRRSVQWLRQQRRDQVEKWRGSPADGHEVEGISTVDLPAAQPSHTVTHVLWEPRCTRCRVAGTPLQHSPSIRCVGAKLLLEGEVECTCCACVRRLFDVGVGFVHGHGPWPCTNGDNRLWGTKTCPCGTGFRRGGCQEQQMEYWC